MTKEEIIKLIKDCHASKDIEEMVITYVNLAYDSGFQDGMKRSSEVNAGVNKFFSTLQT